MKALSAEDAEYKTVQYLLQKLYGIKADLISEFYSFEDQNYFIQINSGNDIEQEFTLKIMHAEISQNPGEFYISTIFRVGKNYV